MQDTPRKTSRRQLRSLEQDKIALYRVIADTKCCMPLVSFLGRFQGKVEKWAG